MTDTKFDPLTVLPDLAAELTALRIMRTTLGEYLKSSYTSATNPHTVAEYIIGRLEASKKADAERRAFMQEIGTIAGDRNIAEAGLMAWVRTSVAVRDAVARGDR
jgi:hypothetical protein